MSLAARLACATAFVAGTAWAAPMVAPQLGRYTAPLCVATSAAPPSCGPAQVDLRDNGTASVRVDDVVYHLKLHGDQVEVVVTHNLVQIDEFTLPCTWFGSTLEFDDTERHSHYEFRFPPARQ